MLKGVVYGNNSVISINDIGETDNNSPQPMYNNALQCISDRTPCCRFDTMLGEWYFPNMSLVPGHLLRGAGGYYRNRGRNDGTVNLNRASTDIISPTGRFCCRIPNTTNATVTLCAIVGKYRIVLVYYTNLH